MTYSKQHDFAEDERARVNQLRRHEDKIRRIERERFQRRLQALGPGPQYLTELNCHIDWSPQVGSPEWMEAA